MTCAECGCLSQTAAGWIALLSRDPDEDDAPDEVVAFCPVCAAREFRMSAKTAETYIWRWEPARRDRRPESGVNGAAPSRIAPLETREGETPSATRSPRPQLTL
jgi:hypothetical protein